MFELISDEQQLEGNNNSLFPEFDLCPIDESLIALDSIDSIFSESFNFAGIDEFFDMDTDDACVKRAVVDQDDVPMVIGAHGSNLVLDGDGSVVEVDIEARGELGSMKPRAVDGLQEMPDLDSCASNPSKSLSDESHCHELGSSRQHLEEILAAVGDDSHCLKKVEVHGESGSLNTRVEINLVSVGEPSHPVNMDEENSDKVGKLSFSIEKDLQKVSLVDVEPESQIVDVNDSKVGDVERKEHESGSGDEAKSLSSSSSSSSSEESSSDEDDSEYDAHNEDDRKNNKSFVLKQKMNEKLDIAGQVEEGEIRDDDDDVILKDMVDSSEDDFIAADDEDDDVVKSGPIRSKNELKSLPPVPRVDATLQPSHQTMPVGVVLSVLGTQVIVEGVETHNPLNEGSILWITERRIPLGFVDEIFGPVKNPYYIVRYNSENEVPDQIHEGTLISFVPEYADHILNDKSMYQKGYDASGDNDEEVDETEFSDDEKEAEYRRMLKNSKRAVTDQKPGNKKNKMKTNMNQPSHTPKIRNVFHSAPNAASGSAQTSNRSQPGFAPQFAQSTQPAGPRPTPNGLVANGMQGQPPPNAMFPHGFPAQNMSWPQQNLVQFPYQMPLMNGMPFQQTGFLPNAFLQGGQPNFMAGQAFSPWQGVMGQNEFNPAAFGMGLQGQQAQPYQNVGGQWVPFQNSGGQTIQFQNMGGLVGPYQNTGGQGVPSQNWRPPQNMGGQTPQNTGGQLPHNMGLQVPQSFGGQQAQNTGHAVPMNTSGQGPPPQNAGGNSQNGGLGMSPKDTVGNVVSSQEMTGTPSTESEDQNHDAPPGFPGKTEYLPNFNSSARGRGRQPYRRGRGRFSRGRNPRN